MRPRRAGRPAAFAAFASVAALALLGACGEMPPPRLAPYPWFLRTREDTVTLSAEVEAMVLPRMVHVIDSLHRTVWGVPSRRTKWRLLVQMTPVGNGGWPYVPDTVAAEGPYEPVRGRFRYAVERRLGPTVPFGPLPPPDTLGWRPQVRDTLPQIPHRTVLVNGLFEKQDSVLVDFSLGAGQPCSDGRMAGTARGYMMLFVYNPRTRAWRPAAITQGHSETYYHDDPALEACRPKGRVPSIAWGRPDVDMPRSAAGQR